MSKFKKYLDKNEFIEQLNTKGWFIAHEFIQDDVFIDEIKLSLKKCFQSCQSIREKNGVTDNNFGTIHHLIGQDPIFLELLNGLVGEFNDLFESFFESKYILNAFGGNFLEKGVHSYASEIHRDVRSYSSDLNLMMNTLIMFDDFTEENGATYLLPGSHKNSQKPNKENFYEKSERAIAKKGSVVFWNSNLWHAAGENTSNKERSSVTPMFTKTFMKPQFDYLSQFDTDNLNENLKQVLGFYSRTPKNLDEWYQPKENRFYRSNQEVKI